jgi:hypothetical protein
MKTPQSSARSRTARACNACAESKLRCGPSRPCDRCKSKGILCEFPQSQPKVSTDSPLEHTRSGDESIYPGNVPHQAIPGEIGLDDDDMQAASSLHQMPTIQFNHMQNARHTVDAFATLPSMTQTNQLPTPTTYDQDSSMPMSSTFMQQDTIMPFDDLIMTDFLRDVMTPLQRTGMIPAISDVSYPLPRDLLDFGFDTSFDWPSMMAPPPPIAYDSYSQLPSSRDGEPVSHGRSGTNTPAIQQLEAINIGQKAFQESPWLWTPAVGDHGGAEQKYLSLSNIQIMPEDQCHERTYLADNLTLASRDRVLAMVLSTCEPPVQVHIVSCFPSADFMNRAINNFMTYHIAQEISWIHSATLRLNDEGGEVLAALFSAGAVLSRMPEVRRVGSAVQETVRTALAVKFENDNRNIRKLRLLQAYALIIDIGLWSGNRRKMEIAESFSLPLITMLRRAGRFARPRQPDPIPDPHDDASTTEIKWHAWVEAESLKRLALYLMIRDTHSSMSFLVNPVMSYAESSLDAPCSQELWHASSAEQWKNLSLAQFNHEGPTTSLPWVRAIMEDTSLIFTHQHLTDPNMTVAIVTTSIWALVWQFRQCKAIERSQTDTSSRPLSTLASSLYQESKNMAQHLCLNAIEWDCGLSPAGTLMIELALLHLHVSLDDIQLLAGKDGEKEARRAAPALRAWAESAESRQGIYHAGQILRAARRYPAGMLRDVAAVAVYHASLTMWAWAILEDMVSRSTKPSIRTQAAVRTSFESSKSVLVRLDVADKPELQRFLVLGKGIPAIGVADEQSGQMVLLSDPSGLMKEIMSLLTSNTGNDKSCPLLVTNLAKLMQSLGKAAAGVLKR